MALTVAQLVVVIYVSLNASVTLFVSILGVIYVRDEVRRRRQESNAPIIVSSDEKHTQSAVIKAHETGRKLQLYT